jgi:cytochrome P450
MQVAKRFTMLASGKLQVSSTSSTTLLDQVSAIARLPMQITKMVGNLIDVWPDAVYSEALVETRLLGRNTVFITDPRLIRTLLVDHEDALVREEVAQRALVPALGNGILTSDGAAWRLQRRIVASAFRPDCIRMLVPRMYEAARTTSVRWSQRNPQEPVDLLQDIMRTALDIILAALVSGDEALDVDAFETALETYIGVTNWKMAYAMVGAPSWLPHPRQAAGAKAAAASRLAMAAIVARRRTAGKQGTDLLGMLLSARDPDTDTAMNDEAIVDNLLTFIAAGHETTALALTWTLRLLHDHPEVEQRVLDEIKVVAPDFAGDPACVDRLVYTRQVIMESMRLFPPAPLIVRRTTKSVILGGTTIQAGSSVHIPIFALHRQERLWPRAQTFEPDRFAPTQSAERERFTYMPFGAGPRVCIGAGLAMTECLVVLASLLPTYRVRPLQATPPRAQMRITLRPVGGMPVRIALRGSRHE